MSSKPASGAPLGSHAAESLAIAIFAVCIAVTSRVLPAPEVGDGIVKRFTSFNEFYPFYLQEHSDQMCKRLHFAGTTLVVTVMALNPGLLFAMLAAGGVGLVLFNLCFDQATGVLEGAGMLATFFILAYMTTRSWRVALLPPLLGYSFAWVGHFFFELNQPATFVYPTFSLAGDFRMWYDMLTGALPL